jgi:hypothetical protein
MVFQHHLQLQPVRCGFLARLLTAWRCLVGWIHRKIYFSLNFWNAGRGKSVFTFSRLFSMPQNCLGLCFNISGSWNCSCALPSLQLYTYLLSACWVCVCVFPLFFTAALYFVRAVLHRSVNHGARCFSHLFGFVDVRLVVAFSTPAFVASSIRFSTFLDRSSLFSLYSLIIVWNLASKSSVEVCYFHFAALFPYSFRQFPSIHRYDVLPCSFPRSAFAVSLVAST